MRMLSSAEDLYCQVELRCYGAKLIHKNENKSESNSVLIDVSFCVTVNF